MVPARSGSRPAVGRPLHRRRPAPQPPVRGDRHRTAARPTQRKFVCRTFGPAAVGAKRPSRRRPAWVEPKRRHRRRAAASAPGAWLAGALVSASPEGVSGELERHGTADAGSTVERQQAGASQIGAGPETADRRVMGARVLVGHADGEEVGGQAAVTPLSQPSADRGIRGATATGVAVATADLGQRGGHPESRRRPSRGPRADASPTRGPAPGIGAVDPHAACPPCAGERQGGRPAAPGDPPQRAWRRGRSAAAPCAPVWPAALSRSRARGRRSRRAKTARPERKPAPAGGGTRTCSRWRRPPPRGPGRSPGRTLPG